MPEVYVDSNGKAGSIQFPRTLAGATVTVDDTSDKAPAAPAKSSTKADWVAYAVSVGADVDDAEEMTKDELVDKYGG